MKTVVFITGTNGTGKSIFARELMKRYGGFAGMDGKATVCVDGRVTFAGKYSGVKNGGVDGLNQTACLVGMARELFKMHDVFICEGSYMNTFGINLTNAIFAGDRQLVVFLYAPLPVLHERLIERSGSGMKKTIAEKQNTAARCAKKWASIGVPVLPFDTAVDKTERIADAVCKKIGELCGW